MVETVTIRISKQTRDAVYKAKAEQHQTYDQFFTEAMGIQRVYGNKYRAGMDASSIKAVSRPSSNSSYPPQSAAEKEHVQNILSKFKRPGRR